MKRFVQAGSYILAVDNIAYVQQEPNGLHVVLKQGEVLGRSRIILEPREAAYFQAWLDRHTDQRAAPAATEETPPQMTDEELVARLPADLQDEAREALKRSDPAARAVLERLVRDRDHPG